MQLNVKLDVYGTVNFSQGFPMDFAAYILPNAEAKHAIGQWGTICLQEIKTNQFFLRHFLFTFKKTLSFTVNSYATELQSLISLNGELDYKIDGLKTITVKEKEFILFNSNGQEMILTVNGARLYSLLLLNYSPSFYEVWLPLFPVLRKDLKSAAKRPRIFSAFPMVARHTVHDAISAIWFDKYVPTLQMKHIELMIESSLFTLLAQTYTKPEVQTSSHLEREKAAMARNIILRDITLHLAPSEIASEIGVSEPWLKKAFSKVYGIGLFHFLRRTRMDRAKEMLLQGASLKYVAFEVGMKPSNFPKEFKAFFGYTVTELKKGQS